MTIRTILVGASGGAASNGAIEMACTLALRFGAHVEGYHVKFDPIEIIAAAAGGGLAMPVDGAWIDQIMRGADDLATRTKEDFLRTCGRYGLAQADKPPQIGASAAWLEEVGRAPALVGARSRFFDLVVLGRSDRVVDLPASDAIERTLLNSGRPVLLAPSTTPPPAIGETMAIGWDGSPQSVRALMAAMPLLQKAKKIILLTVGEKPEANPEAVSEYLGWYGLASERQIIYAVSGVGAGEQLLSSAREAGADMLAMGAFGQASWREMLFGGATRTIVGTSLLPVLLTH